MNQSKDRPYSECELIGTHLMNGNICDRCGWKKPEPNPHDNKARNEVEIVEAEWMPADRMMLVTNGKRVTLKLEGTELQVQKMEKQPKAVLITGLTDNQERRER